MGEFEFEAKLPKSLPCVKGGGAACRDGGIVKQSIVTIPHPLCGSPLCTRGPYICANKVPDKSKFTLTSRPCKFLFPRVFGRGHRGNLFEKGSP